MSAHEDQDQLPTLPEDQPWYDALRQLLSPYSPAHNEKEADRYFTTSEISAALESHFSSHQEGATLVIMGPALVDALHHLGFHAANIGDMGLHWIMKKT